jgi:two-component system, OmpR family, response regulator
MDENTKILVVDDDEAVRDLVERCLVDSGFEVIKVDRGKGVPEIVKEQNIDLVVLDLILPDIDGLSLTRKLKEHCDVGVVILSGRGETTEKVIGLEIGADDYLAKPFEPRELLARLRSVLRRIEPKARKTVAEFSGLEFEGWKLNTSAQKLESPEGEPVEISSGEFMLLQVLVEHPNRVLSREQLLEFTHRNYTPAFDRSVDVQIMRLQKKIEENPQAPLLIKTVRNAGYIFTPKVHQL